MKALEERILKEGKVLPGGVLKVGSFLNQQIDIDFMMQMGEEVDRLYNGVKITKLHVLRQSFMRLWFLRRKIKVPTSATRFIPLRFTLILTATIILP